MAASVLRGRLAPPSSAARTLDEVELRLFFLSKSKESKDVFFPSSCPFPTLLASKQQLRHSNWTSLFARKITVSMLLNKWPSKDLLTPPIVRKHLSNRQRLIMAAVERSGRTQTSILGWQLYLLCEGQSMEQRRLRCA